MGQYAAKTEVSQEKSRMEIEMTLRRYGADAFSYGWNNGQEVVAFRAKERQIRFEIAMPNKDDRSITHYTQRGYEYERSESSALKEWEQACRQKWRALALVVKAKLEAVESGISEFETEFLGHIVLPDGSTVAQQVLPKIAEAYESGQMPTRLLLGAGND